MKPSQRWNTLQIFPGRESNSGGGDLCFLTYGSCMIIMSVINALDVYLFDASWTMWSAYQTRVLVMLMCTKTTGMIYHSIQNWKEKKKDLYTEAWFSYRVLNGW